NQDTVDLSQLAGGPATLDLSSTTTQTVNSNLKVTFTCANAANVIGSPAGNTLTGNSRNNIFTVSTGNNKFTGNGGFDTYAFTGTSLGANIINDPAGSSDALNFHQVMAPISVDLSKSPQTIVGGTVSINPFAVVDVVGTVFNDVLKGNPA